MQEGDEYTVYKVDKDIKDPDSGEILGDATYAKVNLRVTRVEDTMSVMKVESKNNITLFSPYDIRRKVLNSEVEKSKIEKGDYIVRR